MVHLIAPPGVAARPGVFAGSLGRLNLTCGFRKGWQLTQIAPEWDGAVCGIRKKKAAPFREPPCR
jgi:hypothetical protein